MTGAATASERRLGDFERVVVLQFDLLLEPYLASLGTGASASASVARTVQGVSLGVTVTNTYKGG